MLAIPSLGLYTKKKKIANDSILPGFREYFPVLAKNKKLFPIMHLK